MMRLPPPVPVVPCVDSGIAYDDFAETVEKIHDVFLVCFCAIHRNFPLNNPASVSLLSGVGKPQIRF